MFLGAEYSRGEEASAFRLLFQGVPFWPQVWPRKVCLVVVSFPRGGWSREQCNSIIIESSASEWTLKGQVVQPCCNEWEHLWLHPVLRALSSLAWMPQAWGNLYQCLCRRLFPCNLLLLHDEEPPQGPVVMNSVGLGLIVLMLTPWSWRSFPTWMILWSWKIVRR